MKLTTILLFSIFASMSAFASEEHTVETLVGRDFAIEDHWAGQELSFIRKDGAIVAVWRNLGSGRPVLAEKEYPVEVKSPKQCVFTLDWRAKRCEVKIDLSQGGGIRAYFDGIRIYIKESRPNKRTTHSGAAPLRV